MKTSSLQDLSTAALVERFTMLCIGQFEAELYGEGAKENRLIKEMWRVTDELRHRTGDQRSELVKLYTHPNAQVRLMAAKETLAVAPTAARELLSSIRDAGQMPQSLDAGMCLRNLDNGVFKPT